MNFQTCRLFHWTVVRECRNLHLLKQAEQLLVWACPELGDPTREQSWLFLQLLVEWQEGQSTWTMLTQEKMLVANSESELHLGPSGLEWLMWSCQVLCITRSHLADSCPTCPLLGIAAVPCGPEVLVRAWPCGSVQFLLCLSKVCSPLSSSPQLIPITDNTSQRGLQSTELHHLPYSVVGCSRHGTHLQLLQVPPQMHHWQEMAGLGVTTSEKQNSNPDEIQEQAPTSPYRVACCAYRVAWYCCTICIVHI